MSQKQLLSYTKKSLELLKSNLKSMFNFDSLGDISKIPLEKTLYTFNPSSSIFVVGSDQDIGGKSVASIEYTKRNTVLFKGVLDTRIEGTKLEKSGYAGIKTTELETILFQRQWHDLSFYRYLELRIKGNFLVLNSQ